MRKKKKPADDYIDVSPFTEVADFAKREAELVAEQLESARKEIKLAKEKIKSVEAHLEAMNKALARHERNEADLADDLKKYRTAENLMREKANDEKQKQN